MGTFRSWLFCANISMNVVGVIAGDWLCGTANLAVFLTVNCITQNDYLKNLSLRLGIRIAIEHKWHSCSVAWLQHFTVLTNYGLFPGIHGRQLTSNIGLTRLAIEPALLEPPRATCYVRSCSILPRLSGDDSGRHPWSGPDPCYANPSNLPSPLRLSMHINIKMATSATQRNKGNVLAKHAPEVCICAIANPVSFEYSFGLLIWISSDRHLTQFND